MEKPSQPAPVVRIPRHVLADLQAHARDELPNECCGLLVGTGDHVVRSVRSPNLRSSPNRYLIDPGTHFDTIRSARAEGLMIIGVYHSHPSAPAVPSATDAAEAHDLEYLYVIVAPRTGVGRSDLAAYRRTDTGFERVELVPCD